MTERIVLLSIPQLRRTDVTPGALASLDELAGRGSIVDLEPAFPGLAASSFATLVTGAGPFRHGIIGNTYFDRATRRVACPPLPDSANQAPKLWERLAAVRPGSRSMLWFNPNTRGARADLTAQLDADWNLEASTPGLARSLVDRFGPFPRPGPEPGEPPRMEATRWILRTAAQTIRAERPDLAIVRLPYLGQVARRFGPDGREANRAILELEGALAPFLADLPAGTLILAATESVTTPVSEPVAPNRILRGLGLLALTAAPGGGFDIDLERSAAFALADHQLCHIYLNDPSQAAAVASAFSGEHADGIAAVAPGDHRARLGLDHPRSGDVVLVSCPDRWFCGDWWTGPAERPREAACLSGLVPTRPHVPIDPAHVKGSLGAPSPDPSYLGVLVASTPLEGEGRERLAARELADRILDRLSRPA